MNGSMNTFKGNVSITSILLHNSVSSTDLSCTKCTISSNVSVTNISCTACTMNGNIAAIRLWVISNNYLTTAVMTGTYAYNYNTSYNFLRITPTVTGNYILTANINILYSASGTATIYDFF